MIKYFSKHILTWFDSHGRHNLPWQQDKTAYTVWLSEIMLQQTQVKTVIPYFERFLTAFPTIEALAQAQQEQVLTLWSGLGYYARGRNLHKTAQVVANDYAGKWPQSADDLIQLPGIGRSTAHAILSINYDQPTAILDGNVKRVLCRYFGIQGHPSEKAIEKELWQKAQSLMPNTRCGDYTQAMMDMGATICKRSKPLCDACPLQINCIAHKHDLQTSLPTKKTRKTLPVKSTKLFLIEDSKGKIALQQRPTTGLWGGLWTFPGDNPSLFNQPLKLPKSACFHLVNSFRHTFTHFHLDIEAIHVKATPNLTKKLVFFDKAEALSMPIPKPISMLLTAELEKKEASSALA